MYGYGNKDLFSPLRAETSFNENPYNTQKETRNMAELLHVQNPLLIEKNMGDLIMCQKKNNSLETACSRNKVNGSKEQQNFLTSKTLIPNELLTITNYEDIIFGNSLDKEISLEIGSKKGRSFSHSGKDYQDGNYSPKYTNSVNSMSKSKQAKHYYSEGLKNFGSPRLETHKNKEQFDKISAKCARNPSNNLLCLSEKKEVEVIDLESIDVCESGSEKNQPELASNERMSLTENEWESNNEVVSTPNRTNNDISFEEKSLYPLTLPNYYSQQQLKLFMTEWENINEGIIAPKRTKSDSNFEEKSTYSSTMPNFYSQSQMQANNVEKLINDTVSFEFDAIRQLLYLQYICVSRHLHQTQDMFGNQNASSCEFMLKVIDELLQENRLLKKAVIANQRRT